MEKPSEESGGLPPERIAHSGSGRRRLERATCAACESAVDRHRRFRPSFTPSGTAAATSIEAAQQVDAAQSPPTEADVLVVGLADGGRRSQRRPRPRRATARSRTPPRRRGSHRPAHPRAHRDRGTARRSAGHRAAAATLADRVPRDGAWLPRGRPRGRGHRRPDDPLIRRLEDRPPRGRRRRHADARH